jgi:succinyl-CoA synthetase beta subunit
VLDESAGYELLDRTGVPRVPAAVVAAGDPVPPLPFDYPVAVKALAEGLTHKSDAGGVRLDVADAEELTAAIAAMAIEVARRAPGVTVEGFVVEPMVQGVVEVLVGFRRDPNVGPIVLLAPGGVLAELGDQRSIRLAPVDRDAALAMVDEVPVLATALAGVRGGPAGDLGALADAVVALSTLAHDPTVVEAEVNPLLVGTAGAVAVDVLARVR